MVRALLRGWGTRAGGLFISIMAPGATLNLLDLLQAHGLTGEGTAEARIFQEKAQPLKVSSTGKVESWADPRPPERALGECRPSPAARPGVGVRALSHSPSFKGHPVQSYRNSFLTSCLGCGDVLFFCGCLLTV